MTEPATWHQEDSMKKLGLIVVLAVAAAATPAAAFAATPDNTNCWGSVSAQFAQSEPGALGEHASSFDSPRSGIGNVAYDTTGTHQRGTLGAFLGGLLGFSC